MKTLDKPKFEHDCECCAFLGHYDGRDLYYHNGDSESKTVISRYGSRGTYTSGLVFSRTNKHLREAAERAISKGLLSRSEWRYHAYRGIGYVPYSEVKKYYQMPYSELDTYVWDNIRSVFPKIPDIAFTVYKRRSKKERV